MRTKLDEYLESEHYVGLDKVLFLQRRIDGAVAAKMGITSLAPLGFAYWVIGRLCIFCINTSASPLKNHL
jgi:hypothetical protein